MLGLLVGCAGRHDAHSISEVTQRVRCVAGSLRSVHLVTLRSCTNHLRDVGVHIFRGTSNLVNARRVHLFDIQIKMHLQLI